MINKSNALFIFTAYLTFCCCIYQIFYWYPFGINGLEIISFSDILQSTFIRLAWTFLYCFLAFGIIQLLIYYYPKYDRSSEIFYPRIFFGSLIIIIILSVLFIVFIDISFWSFLLASSIAFMAGSIGRLDNIIYSKEHGTNISKTIITCACIFIGIDSALSGYKSSFLVKESISFRYAEIVKHQPINKVKTIGTKFTEIKSSKYEKIKFLGFKSTGEFVFISMDNKDIYFIKSDTIILKFFKK